MAQFGLTAVEVSIIGSLVSAAISVGIQVATAPNVKGPRQKESGIQSSDYGRAIARCWGPSNRVSGTVIWYSGLVEHKRKQSGSGGSTTTFTYSCSVAISLGEGVPGSLVTKIWANKKIVLEEGEHATLESFTYYDGSADQLPDPTMQAALGADEVPGYVHTAYGVVKNQELADLGPTCPQYEFFWVAHTEIDVDQVVSEISDLCGVDIDVSMLAGNVGTLDGYLIDQEISAADALIPIAVAYNFDVAERGGEMVCVPRGMDAVATIYERDAGAVAGHELGDDLIEHTRVPESELPQEVAVSFRDLYRELQSSTQRATRNLGSARANIAVDVPLTLDPDQARRLAHRILWGQVTGRRTAKLKVSPRWINVLPGDIVNLEVPTGGVLPFRLLKSTLGADNVLEWELQADDAEIYNCAVPSGASIPTDPATGTTETPGVTTLLLIDSPIFRDEHDNAGFYAIGAGNKAAWRGYVLQRSTDGGTDYEPITEGMEGGTIGRITSGPLAEGPVGLWDRVTTFEVELFNSGDGELESRSDLSVLNGLNAFWIGPRNGRGGEIGAFRDAELIGERKYRVSMLLRGRRGTEWTVGNHGEGELFVLLDDSAFLLRKDFGATDLDLERLYKPVSVMASIDDTGAQAFTNRGEGLRPWAPAHLRSRRDASGNLAIGWTRRTRKYCNNIASPAPLGEEIESYQVDVFPRSAAWELGATFYEGDVVRELSAVDFAWHWFSCSSTHEASSTTQPDGAHAGASAVWTEIPAVRTFLLEDQQRVVYSALAQSVDGYGAGEIELMCRQYSTIRGYGRPALAVA